MLDIDPRHSALVLIDLQQGILGFGRAPHTAASVVANAAALAQRFHALDAPVVRVKVGWSRGFPDMLKQPTDEPAPLPPGDLPANWLDDPAGLPTQPGDIQILKRQWNAFYGTELDLQLRRRGITTLVIGGIVTGIGVESTTRAGWEQGYAMVIAEDVCAAPLEEAHRLSMRFIMPRLGRVRSTSQILEALSAANSGRLGAPAAA